MDSDRGKIALTVVIVFFVLAITAGLMIGCPSYNVYNATMTGKAELAQADQNRQIQIAVSKAKAEAATYEAQAEVNRAAGVAQANKIIGDSLKGNEEYLRYLYINGLIENKDNKTLIYIPTEAGLPILEAGRSLGSSVVKK
jgi:regulator of protease activity HflC (stomatin/prohibitin superfamily)